MLNKKTNQTKKKVYIQKELTLLINNRHTSVNLMMKTEERKETKEKKKNVNIISPIFFTLTIDHILIVKE